MAHPLAQFADIIGVALISSLIFSIVTIALTIKIMLLPDVSSPWRISGLGFILSMVSTMVLALGTIYGISDGRYFSVFFICYLASGALIFTSVRRLARVGRSQPGVVLG